MNITPRDIANPARKSGYNYVNDARGGTGNQARNASLWRADKTVSGKRKGWQGPTRRTPLEAAQDYCDYVNTGGVATPATLRSAGHAGRRRARVIDAEEAAALGVLRDKRAMRRRKDRPQGFVYCITDGTAVKVGYSLKPEARVAELQTGNPRPLRLLATRPGTEADEKALHVKYLRSNLLQEWFRPTKPLLSEFGLTKEVLNA